MNSSERWCRAMTARVSYFSRAVGAFGLTAFAIICPLQAEEGAPVTVATVVRGSVDEVVEASGSVTAERRSSLSARTAGLVGNVAVDAGSRVEKGDVLLELDSALARLALERSKEGLKEARSGLAERKRLFDEGQKLAATGGIPKTEAEARQAALNVQIAAVNQLEVTVRERSEILDRHRVIAPFSGVISSKLTEVGEWVETGVPVLDLVEVDAVRFDAQLPQERYASLPLDTTATVRLDSLPDRELPARILTKVPVKDPVSRTFLIRLAVEAPSEAMAPGVSGRAVFQIKKSADALTIPRDAIVRQPDGGVTAWVVNGSSNDLRVAAQPVTIGGNLSATVEILSGLEEGQRVVLRGNETLREGQAIRILETKELE